MAGDWRPLRRVCRNPLRRPAPDRILACARVRPLDRLLTHVLLGGTASLYVHVLADVARDVRGLHRSRDTDEPPGDYRR